MNKTAFSLGKPSVSSFSVLGSCYNHILHNSVKHAHKLLPIDIEKNLLCIYGHFSRSAKRIVELRSYYEFYEQDYMVGNFLSKIILLDGKYLIHLSLGNPEAYQNTLVNVVHID